MKSSLYRQKYSSKLEIEKTTEILCTWKEFSSLAARRVTAVPFRPARAVLPIRWIYVLTWRGASYDITTSTFGISIPRAKASEQTIPSTFPVWNFNKTEFRVLGVRLEESSSIFMSSPSKLCSTYDNLEENYGWI